MSRIPGVDPATAEGYVAKVFAAQTRQWGAPLANHLVYARSPALFRAARGMWAAMDPDGRLGEVLASLVNRRVAAINGCDF